MGCILNCGGGREGHENIALKQIKGLIFTDPFA